MSTSNIPNKAPAPASEDTQSKRVPGAAGVPRPGEGAAEVSSEASARASGTAEVPVAGANPARASGTAEVPVAGANPASFALPRQELDTELKRVRVLYVGGDTQDFNAVAGMLEGVTDPAFQVDQAVDELLAIEALGSVPYDAVLVALGRDRRGWTKFVRDRRVPPIPLICVDLEADPTQRCVRRTQLRREGGADYLLRTELSGALLECSIHSAIERARMRRALNDVQERFALAVRGANDGLWEWVLDTNEMFFSRRWRELLGYGVDDIGNTVDEWFRRVHPTDLPRLRADIEAHLEGRKPYHENEHRVRAIDGSYRWVISRGVVQRDSGGKAVRMAGSLTDTSDYRMREQELREQSRKDALTALPRREPFMERLARAVELSLQYNDYAFTVLMVDVDRFRLLADSIGQSAADGVLAILARRLVACVRPEDIVSRIGGDKFAILLENLEDVSMGSFIAERIRKSVNEPFDVDGQTIYSTVSIGMTTSARRYQKAEDVMSDVGAAATRAKERGQDRHEIFETKMRIDALTHLRLEVALRQAVERQEFLLHYQPIVSLDTGYLMGFEALVRWNHPHRGLVPPNEFIPVAEQTGLIIPMGRWALREAIKQLTTWHEEFELEGQLSMSVNLSGKQIQDPRLLDEIQGALANTNLNASTLKLELTESVLMENAETVKDFLQGLRKIGIRIWVDDFGTGYSSLSYLHRFPVDGLKIDKAFVDTLDGTEQSATMVRTILSLAENLSVDVIAEGIEQRVQADQLRQLGCLSGQGYLFGQPIPADRVRILMAEGQG